jgi:hypothetical protein
MSVDGLTEVDEMVFFPPSRNTDQGVYICASTGVANPGAQ